VLLYKHIYGGQLGIIPITFCRLQCRRRARRRRRRRKRRRRRRKF